MKLRKFFSNTGLWYGLGAFVLVAAFLLFKLGSLPGGLSINEYSFWRAVNADQLQPLDMIRNAVFWPHQLGLFLLQQLPFHGAGSLRAISVVFGLFAVAAFYKLVLQWHTTRMAILSTLLFASSGWFLHTTRLASPEVLYIDSIVLLALWGCIRDGKYMRLAVPALFIGGVLALYTPGAILVLLPVVIWQWRNLSRAMRRVPVTQNIATLVISVLLLVPFVLSLVWPKEGTQLAALKTFVGVPTDLPSPGDYLHNIWAIIREICISNNGDPLYHIARLPFLDVFTMVMFVVGLYVMAINYKLDRSKFCLGGLAGLTLLVALHGGVTIAVLLPLVYLVTAEGMSYLLQEWLDVFPRNPVARGLGISIVSIAVVAASFYHVRSYFVAWPHVTDTKNTFSHKI